MSGAEATYLRTEGHEVQEVPDGYVVYQAAQERVHFLNPTAVIVYELCDGKHTVGGICAFMQSAYNLPEPPAEEVRTCISGMLEAGLLTAQSPSSSVA